jgi:hypothetical protein
MQRSVRFLALAAALFLSGAAQANTVSIFEGASLKGTLSDLGLSVTFLGYTAPAVLDSTSPYQANTTTVSPANPQTLVPIANSYFGTSFGTTDEHRTGIVGSPLSLVLDIETLYFSLTLGGNQTAFFQNQSGGALHLTYSGLPGGGNGVSHYSEYGAAFAVPGPIVGAGLPGLMMALGGLVILARRRRDRPA